MSVESFMESQDIGYIEYLIDTGKVDINVQDNDEGLTKLHQAAEKKNFNMAEMLVKKGINQKLKDKYGRMAARVCTSHEIWTLLKDNINEPDDEGNTMLHLTVVEPFRNDDKINAKFLISIGARTDIKNNKGETPYDLCPDKDSLPRPVGIVKTYALKLTLEEQKDLINTMVSSWGKKV